MNYSDISQLANQDSVDEVAGWIKNVGNPQRQSKAQKEHGIHKQAITLEDEEGGTMKVSVMSEAQHLHTADEGKYIFFESVNGKGLVVDRWKTKSGQERVDITANSSAHQYFAEEEDEQSSQGETEKQHSQPEETDATGDTSDNETVKFTHGSGGPIDEVIWIYDTIYNKVLSLNKPLIDSRKLDFKDCKEIATTVFIQASRSFRHEDLIKEVHGGPVPNVEGPQSEIESYLQAVDPELGIPVGDMDIDQITSLVRRCYPYSEEMLKGKSAAIALRRGALQMMKTLKITWAEIYDTFFVELEEEFADEVINKTHDQFRNAIEFQNDEEFYEKIIRDQELFRKECESNC